jgi:hypothetical protein
MRYRPYSFLTSALHGVSGQHHAPAALYPLDRAHGTHWIGGWVGLRAGLNAETTGKILCLCQRLTPPPPVVCSHTLHWLSYPQSLYVDVYQRNQSKISYTILGGLQTSKIKLYQNTSSSLENKTGGLTPHMCHAHTLRANNAYKTWKQSI